MSTRLGGIIKAAKTKPLHGIQTGSSMVVVWFDDTVTLYYYYPFKYVLHCLSFCFVWWPGMAIDASVQYNGGLLPDIILLILFLSPFPFFIFILLSDALVVLVLVFLSVVRCLHGCLSCPTRVICGCPLFISLLFVFCFLVFPPESLPGDDCPLQATFTPASFCMFSSLFLCFVLFCFSPTAFVPGLFWCVTSSIL